MSSRSSWSELRNDALAHPETRAAYDAAHVRFELGRAVRVRRQELAMTQEQLARASGMQQPAIARFEAGGTMPTLPTLERLAAVLELRLSVGLEPLDEAS